MVMNVNFDDRKFVFPDGTTKDDMARVFNKYLELKPQSKTSPKKEQLDTTDTSGLNFSPIVDYFADDEQRKTWQQPQFKPETDRFASAINKTEHAKGGNHFIRTEASPSKYKYESGDGKPVGSTAYGPYQITGTLMKDVVERNLIEMSEPEKAFVADFRERLRIAALMGGRDRPKYEKGGENYHLTKQWQKKYGFDSDEATLNAFDYGGDFGYSEDADAMMLYNSVGKKMLRRTLKDAEGDPKKAAAIWHGGKDWKKKYKDKTDVYLARFEKNYGE